MPRANEIKKGMVLNYNGKLLLVKDIDIQSPTARGAATLYKMRFSDVRTGLKVEERFKGDDIVDTVTLTRRYVDFSYVDGNEYVFMDKEDYTPYTFTKDQIEEELLFMPEYQLTAMSNSQVTRHRLTTTLNTSKATMIGNLLTCIRMREYPVPIPNTVRASIK